MATFCSLSPQKLKKKLATIWTSNKLFKIDIIFGITEPVSQQKKITQAPSFIPVKCLPNPLTNPQDFILNSSLIMSPSYQLGRLSACQDYLFIYLVNIIGSFPSIKPY